MGRRKKNPYLGDAGMAADAAPSDAPAAAAAAAGETAPPSEQRLAGPFALHPHHREIWRSAATEKDRYTLNAVALYPKVPGLVATDSKMLTLLPIQAIDERGEPGPYGVEFRKADSKDAILLPLAVFKAIPKRLEHGLSHLVMTVVQQNRDLRYVELREFPYGNTQRIQVPAELWGGTFPDWHGVIPAWDEREPVAQAAFDPQRVADLAKAMGNPEETTLVVYNDQNAATLGANAGGTVAIRRGTSKRRAGRIDGPYGPEGWEGLGILMPMSFADEDKLVQAEEKQRNPPGSAKASA